MNSPYKARFRVSQIYKGATHKGIDLVGIDSKEIHTTVSGIVERAGWDDPKAPKYGMGKYVRIRDDLTGYLFYFAHLSAISVQVGQRVRKGDKIGVEGSTGNSTGSHLHYEIRRTPNNQTHINAADHVGIPNLAGQYSPMGELEVNMKFVQGKTGFSAATMEYLSAYTYAEDLFKKLANAMK